ncbi:MAG: protease family protein [Actinomycetota bacterium]|nr:protease family protein [Actinomycetota bacterium]
MSLPIPPRADIDPDPGSADGRPMATWTVFHSIGIFVLGNVVVGGMLGLIVLALYGGSTIQTDGATTPLLMATVFVDLGMVGTIIAWLRRRHEPIVALLGIPAPGRWLREIGIGVAAGAILYLVVAFGVGSAVSWLLERLFNEPIVTPDQISPDLSTAGQILAAFLAVVVVPPAEELFFRGVLFRGLRDRQGFAVAATVSACAFGLAHWTGEWHGALVLVFSMVVTGFALALLYDRRKNLVTNIAAHCTFNIIGVILIFWFPRVGS